jgi:predicted MPP superfamily phosphohydrolase
MTQFSRRQFNQIAAATLAAELTRSLWAQKVTADPTGRKFHVALIADTHIIDSFYVKGSENGVEDNESILHTTERLTIARDMINALQPGIDKVFVLGDYFHNYPSTDYEFYFKNTTRLDNAKALTDGFRMPVHLGFGNHDYAVKTVDREMSHRLFKAKFNAEPYSAVDYKGVRFVMANNFLGSTQDRTAAEFNPSKGSFGEAHLQWIEAELAARKPTYLFLHYPLIAVEGAEFKDFGLYSLLEKYKDSVQLVVTGHVHKWIDCHTVYGPEHIIMASTRYDQNAVMLLEIDSQTGAYRWVNQDLVEWNTHFAKPYQALHAAGA